MLERQDVTVLEWSRSFPDLDTVVLLGPWSTRELSVGSDGPGPGLSFMSATPKPTEDVYRVKQHVSSGPNRELWGCMSRSHLSRGIFESVLAMR